MRKRHEKHLSRYGDVAKDEMRLQKELQEAGGGFDLIDSLVNVRTVIDWITTKAAEESKTPKETQSQIFYIQRKKQQIMKRLNQDIQKLDDPTAEWGPREGQRKIEFEDGKYFWQEDEETRHELTVGDLMADPMWGVDYFLDPATVPRNIRKRYFIERSKLDLNKLLDDQIAHEEFEGRFAPDLDDKQHSQKIAYGTQFSERREQMKEERGFLAEQMAEHLLRKIMFDYNLPIRVHNADIHQDLEQKIDFIVQKSLRYRGVDVQGGQVKRVGIQFTVIRGGLAKKRRKFKKAMKTFIDEKIEDVVFVNVPAETVEQAYRKWKEAGKTPGGLMQYWRKSEQGDIIEGVLRDFLPREELDGLLERYGVEHVPTWEEMTPEQKAEEKRKNLKAYEQKQAETAMERQKDYAAYQEVVKNLQHPESQEVAKYIDWYVSDPNDPDKSKKLTIERSNILLEQLNILERDLSEVESGNFHKRRTGRHTVRYEEGKISRHKEGGIEVLSFGDFLNPKLISKRTNIDYPSFPKEILREFHLRKAKDIIRVMFEQRGLVNADAEVKDKKLEIRLIEHFVRKESDDQGLGIEVKPARPIDKGVDFYVIKNGIEKPVSLADIGIEQATIHGLREAWEHNKVRQGISAYMSKDEIKQLLDEIIKS